MAGIGVLKEASSGAMTVTELLTLGLDLYGHLRLPALLVLSEIGIEIMHQRKNMKKVNLQWVAEKNPKHSKQLEGSQEPLEHGGSGV